jgi:hypothetical protein
MAHTALGNTEAALSWLERAFAEHDLHLYGFDFRDAFQPLRAEPRFTDLVRRMALGS